MGRKTMVAVLAAAIGIGAGLLLLATRSFEAPELAVAVCKQAREAVGVELRVSRSRFRLLEGLALEGVTASSDLPVHYQVRLDAIRFEHAPLSLLKGRLELTRLLLDHPRVVIELGRSVPERKAQPSLRAPPSPASAEAAEAAEPSELVAPETRSAAPGLVRVDLLPSQLLLQDGSIAIRDETRGRDLLSLDGLTLDLPAFAYDGRALTPLHALTSNGTLAASALAVENLRLTNVVAGLSTEAGRFRFDGLRFHTDEGDFEGEIDVDFNSIPFRYRMSLTGASVDLDRLAHMPSGALGRALVRFEGQGFGTGSRNLTAKGSLELPNGRLPELAWLSRIDPSLPGTAYDATVISFEVKGGRIELEGLKLASSRSELALAGTIGLEDDHEIDLGIDARVDGRETSYRLRGPLDEPELSRLHGSGASRSAPREVQRER
jgi:AsmA-like C-terminal region